MNSCHFPLQCRAGGARGGGSGGGGGGGEGGSVPFAPTGLTVLPYLCICPYSVEQAARAAAAAAAEEEEEEEEEEETWGEEAEGAGLVLVAEESSRGAAERDTEGGDSSRGAVPRDTEGNPARRDAAALYACINAAGRGDLDGSASDGAPPVSPICSTATDVIGCSYDVVATELLGIEAEGIDATSVPEGEGGERQLRSILESHSEDGWTIVGRRREGEELALYIYIYVYTHTYIYIYVYIYIFI